jgi:transcriptional regulator with XRE-family HTH domain
MANPSNLDRYRKANTELTQKEFAEKLGMSLTSYRRLIEGDDSALTVQVLNNASKILKVPVATLMKGDAASVVLEHEPEYAKRKVPVTVELDGTSDTLDYWFGVLRRLNTAL